jgi:hypothetical protein
MVEAVWRLCVLRLWLSQYGVWVCVEVMVEAVWRLGVCGGYG